MPIEKRVTQSAESLRRMRAKSPMAAKQVTLAMKEGLRSLAMFTIGDSISCGVTNWVGLLGAKLAAKFPAYNIKYADYVTGSAKYGAWQDLVTAGGAERHVAVISGKTAPQLAKADIPMTSGDLDIEFRFAPNAWNADCTIVARRGGAGTICWYVYMDTSGVMHLYWTTDGTTSVMARFNNQGFTANTAGAPYWFRTTLDVDNGSGAYVATLYTSTDGVSWTSRQVITGGATTSVYDHASQEYTIGGSTVSTNLNGKVYEVRINNGIGGYNVCPQPIESWKQSASAASYGGSVGGAPTIYLYNGAITGSNVATYTADILSKVLKRCFDPIILISLSHNDSAFLMGESYYTSLAGLTTEIKKLVSQPTLCYVLQNPRIAPAEFRPAHSRRISQQVSYALNNNYDLIDCYTEFNLDQRGLAALINAGDGVHPSAAGEQLMADVVWDYFNMLNL